MISNRKRKFGLASTLLTLVLGLFFLALNIIFIANKFVDLSSLLDGIFGEDVNVINDNFYFISALAVVDVLVIIGAIKNFKDPIKEDGSVDYRNGLLLLYIVIAGISAGLVYLGLSEFTVELTKIICYVIMAISGFAVLFAIFSFLISTKKYGVKKVTKTQAQQKPDIDTIFATDKITRIKQLKAIGVLSEKEYNDAIAKFSRGA